MKKMIILATCLIGKAVAVVSCAAEPEAPVANQINELEQRQDSLLFIEQIWAIVAKTQNNDFDQDTIHILAKFQEGKSLIEYIVEGKKARNGYALRMALPREEPREGSSLIYKGLHNGYQHYVLVKD